MSELTDDQIKALLKSEYPKLFPQEIERMVKTCRNAKWFKELLKRPPRSVGLTQGLTAANVEKPKDSVPDHLEMDEIEEAKSELAEQREGQIRAMELWTELLLSSHVTRVQHMRCSIGLALLKGSLSAAEVAAHFGVSDETVRVQTKKVEETIKKLGA